VRAPESGQPEVSLHLQRDSGGRDRCHEEAPEAGAPPRHEWERAEGRARGADADAGERRGAKARDRAGMEPRERGVERKETRRVQVSAQRGLIDGMPNDECGLERHGPHPLDHSKPEIGVLAKVEPPGEQSLVPQPLETTGLQDGGSAQDQVGGEKAAAATALHHPSADGVNRRARVRYDRALEPRELGRGAKSLEGELEPVEVAHGVVVGEGDDVVLGVAHCVIASAYWPVTPVRRAGDVAQGAPFRHRLPIDDPPDGRLVPVVQHNDLHRLAHSLGGEQHGAEAVPKSAVALHCRYHDRDTLRGREQAPHGRAAPLVTLQPMRIGIDARLAGPGLGIARFIHELSGRLIAQGVELVWFGDPRLAPEGVAVVRDIHRYPYPVFDSTAGRRWAAEAQVDVVHFPGNTGWTRRGPVPFVLTIQDLIFVTTTVHGRSLRQVVGHRYARRNVRQAARGAARVVVSSEATAKAVRSTLPSTDPRVIYLGVEDAGAENAPAASAPGRREDEPYIVAFAGRDPRKGIDLVLQALRLNPERRYRLRVFAGAGIPDGFDHRAASEISEGRVELLGYLSRAEMWEVLSGAQALVYPSSDEGFGLPVIEAMSVGVPVISGLAPATREIGGDALLVIDPAAPAASIADTLDRLVREPRLRERSVEAGISRAQEFTWERTASRYLDLYAEAAAS